MAGTPDSKTRIETNKANYQRQKNFDALKNGLIKKYVEDALDLKDRQQESIFKITDTPADDYSLSSGYFHACTAFGKTYLMMAMAEGYCTAKSDKKIVIFEENTGVLEQVKQDFIEKTSFSKSDIGAFYGEEKNIDTPIIVCTYASMEKMVKLVGKENIGLVLCDEAHHILSENRQRVAKEFNGCCLYGFTATPDFSESKNCAQVFGEVIDRVTLAQGVNVGLLCSVKNGLMVSRIPVDLTDCKSSTGDYDDKKLMAAIEKTSHTKGIRESLAEFYLNGTDEDLGKLYGKTALINVPNQSEADKLSSVFNEMAGRTIAKAYHTNSGDTPLQEFNAGQFPVLIQVNRLSEGYSNPKIELCINYPTASQVREAQCSGRALRADKENPQKMALVLDIVFKKENGTDVYEEIAKNGQMLFKDIAKDVCVLAPDYQRAVSETTNKKERQDTSLITDDMLFDVITDYEDLFKLAINHEQYLEDSFIPLQKDNDIGCHDFRSNYQVQRDNGTILTVKEKQELFNQLINDNTLKEKGIVAKRKTSVGPVYTFIIGDKLKEFNNHLSGYIISDKIKDDTIPLKKDNDIGYQNFVYNHQVHRADGTVLKMKEKKDLFNRLIQNDGLKQKGIVAERKTNIGHVYTFVIGNKLKEFNNRISDYIISDKVKDDTIPLKQDNDIGYKDFIKNCQVRRDNGTILTVKEKQELFNQLIKNNNLKEKGIVAKRRTSIGSVHTFVIGNKLKEFNNRISGYIISDKDDTIPLKKDNDIGCVDIINNYQALRTDGTVLTNKEKQKLFNNLIQDDNLKNKGIVAERRTSKGPVFPFIIGDKLEEFNRISGYIISNKDDTIPLKQDNDIGNHDFITNCQVYRADGTVITWSKKQELFNQLLQNDNLKEKGIVADRKTSIGHVHPFIIGDKLDEFNQVSGYTIITPKDQLQELQQKAAEAMTPAEKNKYQTQAKKLFENLYPKLKKQNLCPACLEKISGNHK